MDPKAIQREVASLIQQLDGESVTDRQNAINALIKMETIAIPALAQISNNPKWYVRWAVVRIFREMGLTAMPATSLLIHTLGDENSDVRVTAKKALIQMGEVVLPALNEALKHENWRVRGATLQIMSQMGDKIVPDIANVIPKIIDEHAFVRFMAKEILFIMGKPAIAHLIRTLDVEDAAIQRAVKDTLIKIGEPAIVPLIKLLKPKSRTNMLVKAILVGIGDTAIAELICSLKESNGIGRQVSQVALIEIGESAIAPLVQILGEANATLATIGKKTLMAICNASLREMLQILRGDSVEERREIAKKLKAMVDQACSIVGQYERDCVGYEKKLYLALGKITMPGLDQFLQSDREEINKQVIQILLELGNTVITGLAQALQDGNAEIREIAKKTMANVGSPAIPILMKTLHHDNPEVKNTAKETLAIIGEPIFESLAEIFKDEDPNVRSMAIEVLWQMGSRATNAMPLLLQALKDKDWRVKLAASETIGNLGTPAASAIQTLVKLLNDEDWDVVVAVAKTLSKMGAKAAMAVPTLSRLVKHWYSDVRKAAVYALGAISQQESVIASLIEAIADEDIQVKNAAVEVLGNVGVAARNATVCIIKMLNEEENELLYNTARQAFCKMKEAAIPDLIQALKHSNWHIRKMAASVLGEIGAEAGASVPILNDLLQDQDTDVVEEAKKALRKIKEEQA